MSTNLTSRRIGRIALPLAFLFVLSACAANGEEGGKRENLNTYDRFIQNNLGGA